MPLDNKVKAALAEPATRCNTVSPAVAQETDVTSLAMLA
jgi:hypothetical protein